MKYVMFKNQYGGDARIPSDQTPGNSNIEQKFVNSFGLEFWKIVEGPNNQLRMLAFDALVQHHSESI